MSIKLQVRTEEGVSTSELSSTDIEQPNVRQKKLKKRKRPTRKKKKKQIIWSNLSNRMIKYVLKISLYVCRSTAGPVLDRNKHNEICQDQGYETHNTSQNVEA